MKFNANIVILINIPWYEWLRTAFNTRLVKQQWSMGCYHGIRCLVLCVSIRKLVFFCRQFDILLEDVWLMRVMFENVPEGQCSTCYNAKKNLPVRKQFVCRKGIVSRLEVANQMQLIAVNHGKTKQKDLWITIPGRS